MGRRVARSLTVSDLAKELGCAVVGDGSTAILGVANLENAGAGDLTFCSDARHGLAGASSAASAMIVRESDIDITDCVRLLHPAPHMAFAKALDLLYPAAPVIPGVSAAAIVHDSAEVSLSRIDSFACIGANSHVGAGTHVHPNVTIGDDVVIGDNCVIYSGAHIYPGVRFGDRCIVHSGAVIGADGFGFQPSKQGWQKVAQVGGVVIGNDVEIGANTSIDRGAIEDTVIGNGVKIDNLVQIAHNCRIGDHTAIAGCAGIAGSTVVGARCMIGGAAMVVGHLSICDDVVISGGSLVASSIKAPGRYTSVFPLAEHRTWMKIAAGLRRSGK